MRVVCWKKLAERIPRAETPYMPNRSVTALRVERVDAGLVPIYRRMTPAQRVTAGLSATDMIRDRLYATIRECQPEWTEHEVAEAVSERMLGARI